MSLGSDRPSQLMPMHFRTASVQMFNPKPIYIQHCPVYARVYYHQLVSIFQSSALKGIINIHERKVHVKGSFSVWFSHQPEGRGQISVVRCSSNPIWDGNVLVKPPPLGDIYEEIVRRSRAAGQAQEQQLVIQPVAARSVRARSKSRGPFE